VYKKFINFIKFLQRNFLKSFLKKKKKRKKIKMLLSNQSDIHTILQDGMLEKVPGIDIHDRFEVLEYVSSLPFEERISLMLRDDSFCASIETPIENHEKLIGGVLIGGAFNSLEKTQETSIIQEANDTIKIAQENVERWIRENMTAHVEFLKIKERSEQLLLEKEKVSDELTMKTKQMKDLVMAELLSTQKLAEAQEQLALATVRKHEEEKRIQLEIANELLKKAEQERLEKLAEAQEAEEKSKAEFIRIREEAEFKRQEEIKISLSQANTKHNEIVEIAEQEALKSLEQVYENLKVAEESEQQLIEKVSANLNELEKDLDKEIDTAFQEKGIVDVVELAEIEQEQKSEIKETILEKNQEIDQLKNDITSLKYIMNQWYLKYNSMIMNSKTLSLSGGDFNGLKLCIDKSFRSDMNDLILRQTTNLKEKIERLYEEKLLKLRTIVDSISTITEEQREKMLTVIDEYIYESQRESSWFPQIKVYAGYMKQSFEDFLINSDIDFTESSNTINDDANTINTNTITTINNDANLNLNGGYLKENNAVKQLETCLERINTFSNRKAQEVVDQCEQMYRKKIDDLRTQY
jgi:hypothetical protein